jgi:hypothetical protein
MNSCLPFREISSYDLTEISTCWLVLKILTCEKNLNKENLHQMQSAYTAHHAHGYSETTAPLLPDHSIQQNGTSFNALFENTSTFILVAPQHTLITYFYSIIFKAPQIVAT